MHGIGHTWWRRLLAVWLLAAALSCAALPVTMAAYRVGSGAGDSARVAKLAFTLTPQHVLPAKPDRLDVQEVTETDGTAVTALHYIALNPSRTTTFQFQVQNQVDGAVTEVAMCCKLIVRTRDHLPLVVAVKEDGKADSEMVTMRTFGLRGGNLATPADDSEFVMDVPSELEVGELIFAPSKAETHTFTVTVTWNKTIGADDAVPEGVTPEDLVAWTFAGEVDLLEVEARWEQID